MKVLISGGSGLIGIELTKKLIQNGIEVTHLTRAKNSKAGVKTYVWDWKKNYLEDNALDGVTHIVHLAGAGIADKAWTMERKRLIVKSRVLTARLLLEKVNEQNIPLKAFISASGIGYYGATTSEKIYSENDDRGSDFVAECCVQWENAADQFENLCRVVKLRTGIVLDKNGGAVEKIADTIKKGIGAPIGTGKQYMPWIHIEDMVEMYYQSLINENFSGIYNCVSSQHSNNIEFTNALAKSLGKKLWLPKVPSFVIKLMFGEMAAIVLEGSRVSNRKILETGFEFKHNDLEQAMKSL